MLARGFIRSPSGLDPDELSAVAVTWSGTSRLAFDWPIHGRLLLGPMGCPIPVNHMAGHMAQALCGTSLPLMAPLSAEAIRSWCT